MTEPDDFVPPARLRTAQIIAGALTLGVLIFLGVAVFIVQVQRNGRGLVQQQGMPIISLIALANLAVEAVLSYVVPNNLVRQRLRALARGAGSSSPEAGALLGLWQTALIVSLVLVEGAAFLGVIAYLLEGRPYVLGVVVLAILLNLSRFPTEGGVRAWLRRGREFVEREKERMDSQA